MTDTIDAKIDEIEESIKQVNAEMAASNAFSDEKNKLMQSLVALLDTKPSDNWMSFAEFFFIHPTYSGTTRRYNDKLDEMRINVDPRYTTAEWDNFLFITRKFSRDGANVFVRFKGWYSSYTGEQYHDYSFVNPRYRLVMENADDIE
jgi:hypothetical protein